MRTAAIGRKSQLDAAIKEIVELVRDGLRHGYFDYRISCEKGQKGKRHLIVWAGKNHKFTIPEDELERSVRAVRATPETGAPRR